jgi:hypothetical protein
MVQVTEPFRYKVLNSNPSMKEGDLKKKKKSPPTRMITYNNNKIQETR